MDHEEFNGDEPIDEENPDDKELNQLIDLWLSEDRPDLYDSGDKEWMDKVVLKATKALDERPDHKGVIADAARRRVYQREGQATKRTNRVFRNIARTGQLPLGWGEGDEWKKLFAEILNLPISIERKRRRFGAATASDLEQAELENAREEDKRKVAQIETRKGYRWVADLMRAQGVDRAEDLSAGDPDKDE